MFIVILEYKKPIEEVEKHLSKHIDFLDKYYSKSKFICSGRQNPRVGGVILVNSEKEDEVTNIIKEDPFYIHQIAEYKLIEFIPTKFDTRFSCFIHS